MKIFLLVFFTLSLYAQHTQLKKVSLQLLWLNQFEFAGYYMAKEKGFYKEAGFDVELKGVEETEPNVEDIISGKTTYGIGRASLIRYDSEGKKIVLLAAIFQGFPYVLLTLKSSGINTLKDFAGKSLAETADMLGSASITAMMSSRGFDPKSIKRVEHTYRLEDFLEKKVDIYSAYISNEPYKLDAMGVKYNTFSPQKEGFSFFSDLLYTSKKNALENPEEVAKFKAASLKGWRYAFSHIEESVDIILKKYNSQHKSKEALFYEAKKLKELAYFKTNIMGKIDEKTLKHIYNVYKILEVSTGPLNINSLLFGTQDFLFTQVEKEYIKKHPAIQFCTQPNTPPYSIIKDGQLEGIGEGLLDLLSEKTQLSFELVPTKTWKESLVNIAKRKCDFLPFASYSPSRTKYVNFTNSYYNEPIVIVTNKSENYIINIKNVLDKKFSVVRGNSFGETLKKKYPQLDLIEVESVKEGFAKVERGEVFGHIDVLMSSAYLLQKESKINLKIAGEFEQGVSVCFAVRNDDPILFSIINKAVKQITDSSIQSILNKWVGIHYTKEESIPYIKEILTIVILLIFFMFYREYFLKKKNRELEYLKSQLVLVNKQLATEVYDATKNLEKAQTIAKVGSWILDLQTYELECSKETYAISGIDKGNQEELLNNFKNSIVPEDRERVMEKFHSAIVDKKEYICEHQIVLKSGETKYVRAQAQINYSKEGIPLVAHGTVQDITEYTLKEQELQKKDKYLLHQSRLAQMGEMLSMIAHQWKQPLSAISATELTLKTTIQLEKYDLSKESERKEFVEFLDLRLDKIALYVQNLSQTIKDFRDFYQPSKASEYIALNSVILKANELVKESFMAKSITIIFDLNTPQKVNIYESELMQVILNLLSNAKEQLLSIEKQNATITIRSYKEDDIFIIEIEDNGGGIDEAILPKIFDPYFSTKLEKNGTGLGLYMCKMIIDKYHNGEISVQNRQSGAKFSIKLKLNEREDEKKV